MIIAEIFYRDLTNNRVYSYQIGESWDEDSYGINVSYNADKHFETFEECFKFGLNLVENEAHSEYIETRFYPKKLVSQKNAEIFLEMINEIETKIKISKFLKNSIKLNKLKEQQLDLTKTIIKELNNSFSKYFSDFDVEYDELYDIFKVTFDGKNKKGTRVTVYDNDMNSLFRVFIYKKVDLAKIEKCFTKFSKDGSLQIKNF